MELHSTLTPLHRLRRRFAGGHGFTWLELVLAIAITSVIALTVSQILVLSSRLYYAESRRAALRAKLRQAANIMLFDLRETVTLSTSVTAPTMDLDKKYFITRSGSSLFPHIVQVADASLYQENTNRLDVSGFFDPLDGQPPPTQSFRVDNVDNAATSWSVISHGGIAIYTVNLAVTDGSQTMSTRFSASAMMEN